MEWDEMGYVRRRRGHINNQFLEHTLNSSHRHLHEECPVVGYGALKEMGRLFGNWQIGENVVNVLVLLGICGPEIAHFGQTEAVSNVNGDVPHIDVKVAGNEHFTVRAPKLVLSVLDKPANFVELSNLSRLSA